MQVDSRKRKGRGERNAFIEKQPFRAVIIIIDYDIDNR